ncbi:MAG: hopanoid biosynthesis associated radical SAM protein HpnJ [Blastocatellia bacterium]|nr:hopanoid biosynthesis associated radical SAM protein HpnJ [Blastocatellia bacterium]MBN8722442.1 hopanoid biosynthesis associated radical SAM protein HpnJ [Acidobacteriota bacterium]
MKTLLLNPPSFENFDGGASSRWPATREIASFWYPVWLAYPAGMIPESRLLDAPPHGVSMKETLEIAKDYDFVVVFTSTPGIHNDIRMAEMMKANKPDQKITFVGPHVTVRPEETLRATTAIDFVCRKEFDFSVTEFAAGKPLEEIQGVSYIKNNEIVHNPDRPPLHDLDQLPFATEIYARDMDITKYNVPFLLHPYVAFYTERGCPALCTFCLWPQTMSGHPWRTRSSDNVVAEVKRALELFPNMKEIFFDDDTFAWRKSRVLEICEKFKPLKFTWSCTSRVHTDYETLKAMKEAGCRLLIVGFESGDDQILKNIKKGTNVEMARKFMKNCKKLGIVVHGDFILGLPGETKETVERTIKFAKEIDCETIQVSIAHAYPGTEMYDEWKEKGILIENEMTDDEGHQLPHAELPGITRGEIMRQVERFYDEYYFRPRVVARIVSKAIFDSDERSRLYKEAKQFLQLRSKRKEFVKAQQAQIGTSHKGV